MTNIEKALHWAQEIIRETDECLPDCSENLKRELIEQRGIVVTVVEALQEKLAREQGCENISMRHPTEEFICSECGFIIQDFVEAVVDDHDNDMSWSEYEIEFCPHCGKKGKGA